MKHFGITAANVVAQAKGAAQPLSGGEHFGPSCRSCAVLRLGEVMS